MFVYRDAAEGLTPPDPVEDKNTLKTLPCVGQRNTKILDLPVRSILSMRASYNTAKWKKKITDNNSILVQKMI